MSWGVLLVTQNVGDFEPRNDHKAVTIHFQRYGENLEGFNANRLRAIFRFFLLFFLHFLLFLYDDYQISYIVGTSGIACLFKNTLAFFHTRSRNGCVRNLCSKALADLAEAIGPVKFCQTKMNVAVAGKLAVDSQPESRYHGRRMLFLILNQPDLDYLLEKFLQPANLKHVRDVMETLRNKVSGSYRYLM